MENDNILRKQLKIKYIDPHKLKPYEKNARHHGDEIKFLENIIKTNGFPPSKAIEVDQNMVIISGHGRRLAAINIGLKEVPYCVRSDLTPEEVREARLSDNKIADLSGWDFEVLHDELSALDDLGIDMTQFGFEDFTQFDDPVPEEEEVDEEEGEPLVAEGEKDGEKVYKVLVTCSDGADQVALVEELVEKGYNCQIL